MVHCNVSDQCARCSPKRLTAIPQTRASNRYMSDIPNPLLQHCIALSYTSKLTLEGNKHSLSTRHKLHMCIMWHFLFSRHYAIIPQTSNSWGLSKKHQCLYCLRHVSEPIKITASAQKKARAGVEGISSENFSRNISLTLWKLNQSHDYLMIKQWIQRCD